MGLPKRIRRACRGPIRVGIPIADIVTGLISAVMLWIKLLNDLGVRFLQPAAGAPALPAVSGIAWAQAYPARPVRLIEGFGRQGVSRRLSASLDQFSAHDQRDALRQPQ
jgi:hypothetical protein